MCSQHDTEINVYRHSMCSEFGAEQNLHLTVSFFRKLGTK